MYKFIVPAFLAFTLVFICAGTSPAQAGSVAGEWEAAYNTPGGPRPVKLVLSVDGETISGTAKRSTGDVPLTGTVKGDDISFSYTISYGGNDLTLSFTGKISGNNMSGTVLIGSTEDSWSAKRTPPAKAG
jgi:hypothetical protein